MKLIFVTGNSTKHTFARHKLYPFKVELIQKSLDLEEIQSDSIEKIAQHKADQAYKELKEPLIVSDHGWFIPALNGFPGAYMKYVNEWFTPRDFLNLMEPYEDRRVILKQVICFTNGEETKLFVHEAEGKILRVSKGGGLRSSTTVISYSEDGKSIAEVNLETGKSAVDDSILWKELADWLKENQLR